MNRTFVLLSILISLVFSGRTDADDAPRPVPLYDRIESRLAAEPQIAAAIGKPSPEMRRMAWLVGRWRITSHVFKTTMHPARSDHGQSTVEAILGGTWLQLRDRYDGQPADLGFLTFNPVTHRWISVGIDRSGNAITSIGDTWEGNRLVLVAENADILGEQVVLRQTMEKRSGREYRVLNEERTAAGEWVAADEYIYRKLN